MISPPSLLQNQERKHRTYVYVLIVTELLEDWEDSVNIGKALHLFTCQNGDHRDKVLNQSPAVCHFCFSFPGLIDITIQRFYCRFVVGETSFVPSLVMFTLMLCTVLIIRQMYYYFFFCSCVVSLMS